MREDEDDEFGLRARSQASVAGEVYEEGEKMSAITKIIEKATLIDLYEVLAGQTQSVINPYY